MTRDAIQDRLQAAISFTQAAGRHTLKYFAQSNFAVEFKRDASPVTVADREAEQLLRDAIAAQFPADGVLGEEFGEVPGQSGYRWILDPVDGTKSFVCGVPLYGTLVGIEYGGRSVAGVMCFPALDELAYASVGHGAWHQRGSGPAKPAKVSERLRYQDSVFCTSEVKSFGEIGRMETYQRLQSAAWLSRTWGDCYGYLLVATGRADVMVDPLINLWDCAALQPILEEAGGTFTDWDGHPTIYAPRAVATNGRLLPEVLGLLASA